MLRSVYRLSQGLVADPCGGRLGLKALLGDVPDGDGVLVTD